jgi:hypothetical protein
MSESDSEIVNSCFVHLLILKPNTTCPVPIVTELRDAFLPTRDCYVTTILLKEVKPTTFGIFYNDLNKPRSGGTGHTMKVCEQKGIPFIDQNIWFKWFEEQNIK